MNSKAFHYKLQKKKKNKRFSRFSSNAIIRRKFFFSIEMLDPFNNELNLITDVTLKYSESDLVQP